MNWKDWTIAQLVSLGMFQDDAEAVFALIEADESNAAMKGRWSDKVDDYGPSMQAACLIAAKATALKWIEEHQPDAWYKPMFGGKNATKDEQHAS